MRAWLIGVLACVGIAAAASGVSGAEETEEPNYSRAFQACDDAAGSDGPALVDCAVQESERQDRALNLAYQALMAKYEPGRKTKLVAAERAWIAFRDVECEMESASQDRAVSRVAKGRCVMRTTYNRLQTLQRLLNIEP
jgi:uncharacterized protein YecT (DUF1311 family)